MKVNKNTKEEEEEWEKEEVVEEKEKVNNRQKKEYVSIRSCLFSFRSVEWAAWGSWLVLGKHARRPQTLWEL